MNDNNIETNVRRVFIEVISLIVHTTLQKKKRKVIINLKNTPVQKIVLGQQFIKSNINYAVFIILHLLTKSNFNLLIDCRVCK